MEKLGLLSVGTDEVGVPEPEKVPLVPVNDGVVKDVVETETLEFEIGGLGTGEPDMKKVEVLVKPVLK